MNIEQRLRDAFAQRTGEVEVTPGALFEIQRRTSRTRRLPQVRLRPAFVLVAAACAAIATVVSVTLTQTAPDPGGEIAATPPVAATPDPAAVAPLPERDPGTTDPPPEGGTPPPPPAGIESSERDSGQLTTVAPPTPPAVDPTPADAPATPPPPQAGEKSDTGLDEATTTVAETTACPVEPAGDDGTLTASVTVYFACGDTTAAPRKRAVATNDLATALGILLGGPNEADTTAGFRGLSADSTRTATAASDSRWVTIDLPGDLGDAFDAEVGVTAQQFLTQLNATVFQFSNVGVAEYRLDGDCAAFGDLLDQPCQVHRRDGDAIAVHTSELTAHTIGNARSVIRAEADDAAGEVGLLADGTRLTDRRSTVSSSTWAEVITTAGQAGWVSTDTLVAQPLTLTSDQLDVMASLAGELTSGPNVESASFVPGGLVVRWGADPGDVKVLETSDAGTGDDWWNRTHDIPSPRDSDTTASPADLFWIDGSGDSAVVRINAPGPLGAPHSDFANLAYVSIYQASVGRSTLPPKLESAPTPTTTTAANTNTGGNELPPALPTDDGESGDSEETPDPLRAQISVIFDFLSSSGPRIAAVEAIWIEP